MKGRTPNAAEKRWHDQVASVGCIACILDGNDSPPVSIHHIAGRTQKDAHWLVLPLCSGNHQHGTGIPGLIAVHPYKARFEARYGKQLDLLGRVCEILCGQGVDVPQEVNQALLARGH